MKKYIVTYTKDYGTTYECREVESESFTAAYVIVDLTLLPTSVRHRRDAQSDKKYGGPFFAALRFAFSVSLP